MMKIILPVSVGAFFFVSCQQQAQPQQVQQQQVSKVIQQPVRTSVYQDSQFHNNPALTSEHASKVDQVRRSLYKGEGYFDLGAYDQARAEFQKVLAIDPYNKAAMSWIERCPR
ncbi:tetratricopeptide repeat protein [Akkermansiaceae bacterium]|nr:tetratricopeptide repeat protein [Akkermansiaceae bacterium]